MYSLDYGTELTIGEPRREYMRLSEGDILHFIMNIIDPRPYHGERDLHSLRKRLRAYYQDGLQQLILMSLPDTTLITQEPITVDTLQEMENLLSLLLGAAVQCENREQIITRIRTLTLDSQIKLAEKIQEMTQDTQKIIAIPGLELSHLSHPDLQEAVHMLSCHLRDILRQRDEAQERLSLLRCEQESTITPPGDKVFRGMRQNMNSDSQSWRNRSVHVTDLQSKLRRARQEIEEKGEELLDSQQQVEILEMELRKLHHQVQELSAKAALAQGYRDELDNLRERSRRLETQVNALNEKLRTMEIHQRSLQEEKEFSRALLEDKEVLEHQLVAERERSERLRLCEKEKHSLEERLQRLEMERESECQRVQFLLHDNLTLAEEVRVLREEVQSRWERVYEAHRETTPTWERQHETDGEVDQGWERLQERGHDFLDLNSELSEALLRLEKENQNLRERLESLSGKTLDQTIKGPQVSTERQHGEETDVQIKSPDLCVREEPDGGSLGEKDQLPIDVAGGSLPEQGHGLEEMAPRKLEGISLKDQSEKFKCTNTQRNMANKLPISKEIRLRGNQSNDEVLEVDNSNLEHTTDQLKESPLEQQSENIHLEVMLEDNALEIESLKRQLKEKEVQVQHQQNLLHESTQEKNVLHTKLQEYAKEIQTLQKLMEKSIAESQVLEKELKYREKQSNQKSLQDDDKTLTQQRLQVESNADIHPIKRHFKENYSEELSLLKHQGVSERQQKSQDRQMEEGAKEIVYLKTLLKDREHSHTRQLGEAMVQIELLKGQMEASQGQGHILERQLQDTTESLNSLKRQLKEKEKESQRQLQETDAIQKKEASESKSLEVKLKKGTEEIQLLRRQIKESEDVEAMRRLMETQEQSLKTQLKENSEEIKSLKSQLKESCIEKETCKRHLKEKEELETSITRRLEESTSELKSIRNQMEEKTEELESLKTKVDKGEIESRLQLSQLEENLKEINSLKIQLNGSHNGQLKELQSLKSELEEKEILVQELMRDLQVSEGELQSLKKLQEKSLNQQLEEKEGLLRQMIEAGDSVKRQLDEKSKHLEDITRQLQVSAENEDSLQRRLNACEENLQTLQGKLEEATDEIESQKKHLETSREREHSLSMKLLDSTSEIQLLKRDVENEKRQHKQNKIDMNAEKRESQLKQQYDQGALNTLKRQLQDNTEEIKSLIRQLEKSAAEIQTVKKQLEESAKELQMQKRQMEESVVESLYLKRQLEEREGREQSLKRQLEESNSKLQKIIGELQEHSEEKKTWTSQLKENEKEMHTLRRQLDEKKHESLEKESCMSAEILSLKNELENRTGSLKKSLKEELQESNDKMADLQRQLKEREEEIETLERKLQESTDEILLQKKQIDDSECREQSLKRILKDKEGCEQILRRQIEEVTQRAEDLRRQLKVSSRKRQLQESTGDISFENKQIEETKMEGINQVTESGEGNLPFPPKKSQVASNAMSTSATSSVSPSQTIHLPVSTVVSPLFSLSTPATSPLSVLRPKSLSFPLNFSLSLPASHSTSDSDSCPPLVSTCVTDSRLVSESETPSSTHAIHSEQTEPCPAPLTITSHLPSSESALSLLRQEGELERAQRELRRGRSALRIIRQEHRDLQERQEPRMHTGELDAQWREASRRAVRMVKTSEERISELRELKRQLGTEQREKELLEREHGELREQVQRMEISNKALTEQCQMLSQEKLSLQDQNNLFLSQIHSLSCDNRELLERSLQSGELRQEEERRYREKLTELKHEKQKLLDKIMDQYRVLEPAPITHSRKSNWITDKMKRLLRAKDRPQRGPGDSPRILIPPVEPTSESEKGSKQTATLRRSRSSITPSSPVLQGTFRSRNAKLSSTIRSSESFSSNDSTPRERFRLRRRGQVRESDEEDGVGRSGDLELTLPRSTRKPLLH
ncbi:hypothetical protein GDO86_008606 [Hymenochirus boettgeri]|uniref:HOOK N-terminal domain-containing protein n=1 Tax=Hymenochirus boettgeri TaxID=247094 RepID=A0A8T2J3S6_9PIPI|nr:hypothetical protein GDO86_008606 [Hymenochirus boettgeri]